MTTIDKKSYNKYMKIAFSCQAFHYASQLLWEDYSKNVSAGKYIPFVVNASFTSELALKGLLVKCNCGFKTGHKVYELFLQLPQEAQDCILAALQVYYPKQDIDILVNQIKLVSDYFYKVRYIADYTIIIDISFCKNLMESLFLIEQRLCGIFEMVATSEVLSAEEEKQIDIKMDSTYCALIQEADKSASKLIKNKKLKH